MFVSNSFVVAFMQSRRLNNFPITMNVGVIHAISRYKRTTKHRIM
jgi:hypothetical protein